MQERHWNALLFCFSLTGLLALFFWNAFSAPILVPVSEMERHLGENVQVVAKSHGREWKGSALQVWLDSNHVAVLFSPTVQELELIDSNHWLNWSGKVERFRGKVELQVVKVEETQ